MKAELIQHGLRPDGCARLARTAPPAPPFRRFGLTLVELVAAMAIASVLVTGLAAALVLATRALPREDRPVDRVLQTSQVLDWMLTELQSACHVTERGTQAITFTVADRDADGSPERIRYAWSGIAGEPLTRQYRDGPPTPILNDVHDFDLTYETRSVTEVYPGPPVEGSEALVTASVVASDRKDYTVDNKSWIGQYAAPPPGAAAAGHVSWRITRVWLLVRRAGGNDDQTRIQICVPNADRTPSATVLDERLLNEATLTDTFTWVEVRFDGSLSVPITQGLCVVLRSLGGKPSLQTRYDNAGGSGLLTTNDGGSSWTHHSSKSLLHAIYGRPAAPGPNQTVVRNYLTAIRLGAQSGPDTTSLLTVQSTLPNAPEVLSAVWEVEFDTDPTRLDMNADGQGDWRRRDGAPFDPLSLQRGEWKADSTLDTNPEHRFDRLTTVEVRFRCGSAGGSGAAIQINADWAGDTYAPISAYLNLLSNNTQRLTVFAYRGESTPVTLTSVSYLPADPVTLRLLIDPDLNTVNVRVNGADQGTYRYFTFGPPKNPPCATLFASGCTALFDRVSIRVAGDPP